MLQIYPDQLRPIEYLKLVAKKMAPEGATCVLRYQSRMRDQIRWHYPVQRHCGRLRQ